MEIQVSEQKDGYRTVEIKKSTIQHSNKTKHNNNTKHTKYVYIHNISCSTTYTTVTTVNAAKNIYYFILISLQTVEVHFMSSRPISYIIETMH